MIGLVVPKHIDSEYLDTELAKPVRSPAPHRGVVEDGACVILAGSDGDRRSARAEGGGLGWGVEFVRVLLFLSNP